MVRALEITTVFCLGVLAGAMLLIGGAIVPYWFSLDPAAFAAWFARNSPFLGAVMVPLGGASTLLALATAFSSWRRRTRARSYFVTAAVLAGAVALVYFLEHASLNAEIESGSLSPAEIVSAREEWRSWHWVRTGAGLLAFLAGLVGLARAEGVESSEPVA